VESLHALEFIEQSIKPIVYDIENANFEFYGKTGAVSQRPRDERALQTINGTVGSFRKIIRREKFPAEAKAKAEKMIKISS
jgi:predicted metalloendopeptidase